MKATKTVLLFFLSVTLFITSCEKNNDDDNGNITTVTLNSTINYNTFTYNFDANAYFQTYWDTSWTDYGQYFFTPVPYVGILTNSGSSQIRLLNEGELINDGSLTWNAGNLEVVGSAGIKYAGFFWLESGNSNLIHFGWIKLNIINNNQIEVVELGYQDEVGVSINAGEK